MIRNTISIILITLIASHVFGHDLAKKHSIAFDLRYECDVAPDEIGFEDNGVISSSISNGWLIITTPNYGTYLNDDVWVPAPNAPYTVEIRCEITDPGISWSIDNGINTDGIGISTNGIFMNYVMHPYPFELGSIHTIRFAAWTNLGVRLNQVWIDGKPLCEPQEKEDMFPWNYYFRFGMEGNSALTSRVDYIRMDRTGAFAPDLPLLKMPTPSAIEWDSVSGINYQVQFSTNLVNGIWSNVGDPISGGGIKVFELDHSDNQVIFYRIYEVGTQ